MCFVFAVFYKGIDTWSGQGDLFVLLISTQGRVFRGMYGSVTIVRLI